MTAKEKHRYTIGQLVKITGIARSSLLTYVDGAFIHIPRKREKVKYPSGTLHSTNLYSVTADDITDLKEYKKQRMRKYE